MKSDKLKMEDAVKHNLEKMIADLMSLKPMLPGSISEQYNVCGKANCRCKDKVNPQKHGPQSRLSYSLPGKNSTIVIRKADVPIVSGMTDNFKNMRQLISEISIEAVKIYREDGADALHERMTKAISKGKAKISGVKSGSAKLIDIEVSRDKWKARAKERTKMAQKGTVTIKNLTDSREKWKAESMFARPELKRLKEHGASLATLVTEQAQKIRLMENDAKKRGL